MRAIIFFQGFTESIEDRTGSEDCYFRVIREHLAPDTLAFLPRPWTDNVKDLARQLARQGVRSAFVLCYSHGQAAAVDFAKWAYKLGIRIDVMLTCDAVMRPDWLPRKNLFQIFSFRSLGKHGVIRIPRGVGRVNGVRQETDYPRGHYVVAKDKGTRVVPMSVLKYPHTAIDSSPEWFHLVKKELDHWLDE